MHPSIDHVLQFFAFDHLPPHLQEVSRKLLESKDAAVRAALVQEG